MPLSAPPIYWKDVNRKVADNCSLLYLEHLGATYSVPRMAIEKLLDTGNEVKIRMFSKDNTDVLQQPVLRTDVQSEGHTSVQTSLAWKDIDRMYVFVDALHNYSDVMAMLHPMNYGARVILRGFHRCLNVALNVFTLKISHSFWILIFSFSNFWAWDKFKLR